MVAIKLGGSLLASGRLAQCLDKIEQDYNNQNVVIVPGGGLFADQVRQLQRDWCFDDRIAHEMAILGMRQMALLIKGLKSHVQVFDHVKSFGNENEIQPISVWSPSIAELDEAGLPSTWELTSDSLAVWLALKLKVEELIVVKSATVDQSLGYEKLAAQKIVDNLFCRFAQQADFLITIVNINDFIHGCIPNVIE